MAIRELEPIQQVDTTEGSEGIIVPHFVQNLTEIKNMVNRHGTTLPTHGNVPLLRLASSPNVDEGFRADVPLVPDRGITLIKRGHRRPGVEWREHNHVEMTYRPDTATTLRVDRTEYPESKDFEWYDDLPQGSIIFDNKNERVFSWIPAHRFGPRATAFLECMTAEALEAFSRLDQANPAAVQEVFSSS